MRWSARWSGRERGRGGERRKEEEEGRGAPFLPVKCSFLPLVPTDTSVLADTSVASALMRGREALLHYKP